MPAFLGKIDEEVTIKTTEVRKGKGHILIMDDEKLICDVAIRILTKLGFTAEAVADGDQAVALYRQRFGTEKAFDAVILDLTVPGGKGGKEAIAALKKINPAIKAVVSSGYSNDDIMANHKDYGFSAILQKPYTIEEMSEVLYNLLTKDKK